MPDTVIDPRALDVQVAREVYIKRVVFLAGFKDEAMESSSRTEMGWYEIDSVTEGGGITIGRRVPNYSQDVAAAQEICEDFPVSVESDGAGRYRFLRRAVAQAEDHAHGEWEGDMAMAICHGALAHAKAQRLAEGQVQR